jgi:hypothetical protein
MQINNLHQPYIFEHEGNIELIVSEILDEKLEFEFGEDKAFEDYWKLCHLDSNYNKTTINTPSNIFYDDENYFVIAECNGFIYQNKISYIAGIHTKKNQESMSFLLVQGDFDMKTKKVSNLSIKDNQRTGFIKEKKYTYQIFNNSIISNNSELILNCSNYLDSVVRIIPICETNSLIFTGREKNGEFRSFVLDLTNKNIKSLQSNETNKIYKSSIFNYKGKKVFAYTDKIFRSESKYDHILNIHDDYILKDL